MVDKFLVDGKSGSRLSPGEVGCYASHLLAYEIIMKRDLKHAIILEDDIIIDRDLHALALLAASKAPNN